MDTLTQVALGAAIGELTLGEKEGNKAVLWGGIAGGIPDLDIIAAPFMDSLSYMGFHRSVSHSLFLILCMAPLLGVFLTQYSRTNNSGFWGWTRLFFWALVTHSLLDCFTSFGTQLFWPFSRYRVAFHTISVIDPLYSIPLLASVIMVFFFRMGSRKRRVLNYLGLGASTLYLAITVVNSFYIESVFEKRLEAQNIDYSRLYVSPTPLNTILWRGVAETSGGYYTGYYSLFDGNKQFPLDFVEKNHYLISPYRNESNIRTLLWINNGFYTISPKNGALYMNDMRYGRMNGWRERQGNFIFSFRISDKKFSPGSPLLVKRERPPITITESTLISFVNRILGEAIR